MQSKLQELVSSITTSEGKDRNLFIFNCRIPFLKVLTWHIFFKRDLSIILTLFFNFIIIYFPTFLCRDFLSCQPFYLQKNSHVYVSLPLFPLTILSTEKFSCICFSAIIPTFSISSGSFKNLIINSASFNELPLS